MLQTTTLPIKMRELKLAKKAQERRTVKEVIRAEIDIYGIT